MSAQTHVGQKISRIRELRGMKQETLAEHLGISQQAVSKIEQSESVDELMLERIAKALGVTPMAVRNFSDEAAIFNIQNNYEGSNQGAVSVSVANHQCTFNPLDEIKRLNAEKDELYRSLLKEKDEKIAMLERMMGKS